MSSSIYSKTFNTLFHTVEFKCISLLDICITNSSTTKSPFTLKVCLTISQINEQHYSYCCCRATKQWRRHFRFLWALTPGTALWVYRSMGTFIWKWLYPPVLSDRDLKLSFSRCFGALRFSSWRALLLRPSCQTINSAVSKPRLVCCCLNSYWSAIIAAFFVDVRWQFYRKGVKEEDLLWENTLTFGRTNVHIVNCGKNQRIL